MGHVCENHNVKLLTYGTLVRLHLFHRVSFLSGWIVESLLNLYFSVVAF